MLNREEYIEQAYFFRILVERIEENVPLQELFRSLKDEVLSTTKLPLAIDYLLNEMKLSGYFAPAMARLAHYFTRFQTYIIEAAEDERGRFDMRVALQILRFLAEFMQKSPNCQSVFLYQFEVLCRNRLGYDEGLAAMAEDPVYPPEWSEWIQNVRREIGILGLADMIFVRSEHYLQQQSRLQGKPVAAHGAGAFPGKGGQDRAGKPAQRSASAVCSVATPIGLSPRPPARTPRFSPRDDPPTHETHGAHGGTDEADRRRAERRNRHHQVLWA